MLVIFILIIIAAAFAIAGFTGAPYVPILRHDTNKLLELANLKAGQTLIDLGAGDGRLLRAAASQGIRCIGYEINPFMVAIAKVLCWPQRRLISIHLANFWQIKLPDADAVYVFLMPKFMPQLNRYLRSQIRRPIKVVSYAFEIPGHKPISSTKNTFVYNFHSQDEHELEQPAPTL